MFNILASIKNNLEKSSPIINNNLKQFSNAPSKAMCYSETDMTPIGACIRSVYLSNKKYPQSNPTTIYLRITAEAGKLWEKWLINQYKELGIYIDSSVKLYEKEYHMSGEFDILHYNPDTDEVEITECKQYNGSNYYAAMAIKGGKNTKPAPKDAHLLQCFDYLLMCKNSGNESIKTVNLMYLDRSCSSFSNFFQFSISLEEKNDKYYPLIKYFNSEGNIDSYVDDRISDKAIYEKNTMLEQLIDKEVIPPRDYILCYDDDTIQNKLFKKEINATKYSKYKADPIKNPIGDWNCIYCPFGPDLNGFSTCWSMKD